MKPSHTIRRVFDDPNLVSAAGLVPALRLAESAGFYDLLGGLSVASPNAPAKTVSVVGGMLAGADSIDDLDLLRLGGMGRLFGGVRAPSTLGTFLRAFTQGHVQQLDKIGAGLLAGLAAWVPDLLAGGDEIAFLDLDDTVREVHGYAKQGAAFGYTGQRGLNVQLATISTPTAAPVIARARLRKANSASAIGAGRLFAKAITPARAAAVSGQILARAESAYYGHAVVGTALRHKTWFSVTARVTTSVTAGGGPRGDRVQHRPRHGGRSPDSHRALGNRADQAHQHPGPDRDHRPTPRPPPAIALAVVARLGEPAPAGGSADSSPALPPSAPRISKPKSPSVDQG